MSGPLKVLCLDLEGGRGGSSRSLYHVIEARDPSDWTPLVITRLDGEIGKRYRALGVEQVCIPELPSFRPSERKNAIAFLIWLWRWRHWRKIIREIESFARAGSAALVHVNHESLVLSGALIAARLGLPWTCHVRTQLIPGFFARFVYRTINRRASGAVFITEPNRRHFSDLVGDAYAAGKGAVILNPAPKNGDNAEPLPVFQEPASALRVLSLSSFSPNRGVDRIIDVASELTRRGRSDIVFYLCGRLAHKRLLPFSRNTYLEDMTARVQAERLHDIVLFPGYVSEPVRALSACDVLIKLTRQSNPWGRDIIEAMSVGRPVVTLGTFNEFVTDGDTGVLHADFDPSRIATELERLADDPDRRRQLGEAAAARAEILFDPRRSADALFQLFRRAQKGVESSAPAEPRQKEPFGVSTQDPPAG